MRNVKKRGMEFFFKKVKRKLQNNRTGNFKRSSREQRFFGTDELRLLRRGLKGGRGLCSFPRYILKVMHLIIARLRVVKLKKQLDYRFL